MLFADDVPPNLISALAAIATALVGAWLTVRVHKIDRSARRLRRRIRHERARCDGLEQRLGEVEQALADCEKHQKPHRPKPRR